MTAQSFTVVYDNNADKLGLFDPEDTAVIVNAMVLSKDHIESINQAYEGLGQFVTQVHESMRAGLIDAADRLDELHGKALIDYGDDLRAESREALAATDSAIDVLRKYSELGPSPGAWAIIKTRLSEIWGARK